MDINERAPMLVTGSAPGVVAGPVTQMAAARNDRDRAFAWLERAVIARDLNLGHELRYDPMFDALRTDVRLAGLLREMKVSKPAR
jgi:hypothetical protein